MFQDYSSRGSNKYTNQSTVSSMNSKTVSHLRLPNRVTNSTYSVPCVNCETLVPLEDIDRHCLKCTSVSKSVTAVSKSHQIHDEINFKIQKLRESLQYFIKQEKMQENLNYLHRADELCEQISHIQHGNAIEVRKVQDLNQELKTLTESFRGSLCIALYLERLHSLGIQKQTQIEKDFKSPRLDHLRPSTRYDQSQQYQSQQQPQQQQFNNSQNSQRFQLQSPLMGRPTMITKFSGSQDRSNQLDMKSEILTQMSTSKWDQEENYQDMDQQGSSQFDLQQRAFYSKCLAQKMKLPNNHPSQKIPLCVLHKEAVSRRIPQAQWDRYIVEAMNNPSQYLDMKKVQQTSQSGLKNNLRSMTQEGQFKQRLNNL